MSVGYGCAKSSEVTKGAMKTACKHSTVTTVSAAVMKGTGVGSSVASSAWDSASGSLGTIFSGFMTVDGIGRMYRAYNENAGQSYGYEKTLEEVYPEYRAVKGRDAVKVNELDREYPELSIQFEIDALKAKLKDLSNHEILVENRKVARGGVRAKVDKGAELSQIIHDKTDIEDQIKALKGQKSALIESRMDDLSTKVQEGAEYIKAQASLIAKMIPGASEASIGALLLYTANVSPNLLNLLVSVGKSSPGMFISLVKGMISAGFFAGNVAVSSMKGIYHLAEMMDPDARAISNVSVDPSYFSPGL